MCSSDLPAFAAAKWLCDRHTPMLEQKTLAEFIASGMYERHLRRVRRANTRRRKVLLDSLQRHIGDRAELTGDGAGAHVVLWPRQGGKDSKESEASLVARAAALDVGVYGISEYYLRPPRRPGLLLGYSRLNEHEIREGIRRLGEVI